MPPAQATINVRINGALKERGDSVLRKNGVSTTQAIRGLWEQLAQTRQLPDFLQAGEDAEAEREKRRRKKALLGLANCARVSHEAETDEALDQIRFEALMEKYEALA